LGTDVAALKLRFPSASLPADARRYTVRELRAGAPRHLSDLTPVRSGLGGLTENWCYGSAHTGYRARCRWFVVISAGDTKRSFDVPAGVPKALVLILGARGKNLMDALPRMRLIALAIALGLPAFRTQAALVLYPDLATFFSAAGVVALESFEQTVPLPYGAHPPTSFDAFTLSTSGSSASNGHFGVLTTGPTMGQHATEGTHYLAYNARTFRLSFSQPIRALSLDFVDFGDLPLFQGQELTMTTSAGDSVLLKKTVGDFDPPNGNEFFIGFTSEIPLTEVVFHTTIPDNMNVDAVRYAVVPEPSATLVGLCGAVWMLSRRRGLRCGR
jgi:hypothetical protein